MREIWRPFAACIFLAGLLAGCSAETSGAASAHGGSQNTAPGSTGSAVTAPASFAPAQTSPGDPPADDSGSGTASRARPLAGKTVGIDPGHDGGNFGDPDYI